MTNLRRSILLFIIILIGIFNIFTYWNSHIYYIVKDKIDDLEKKVKKLERANLFYPSNDLIFYELGKAYFDLGIQNLQNIDLSSSYLLKSIQNFTRSLRINPTSYFCHFNLAQSLLYLSYMSPEYDANYSEEYKKAALLAGHNNQIYYEVGKILLSRWPMLSEEDKEFTSEILKRIFEKKETDKLRAILQIWEMNIRDYKLIKDILPEDAGIYRMYAKFLGEKNLATEERQRLLAKAELLEFEKARSEYHFGERELQYYRLKEAFNHFAASLSILEKINFYQNLASQTMINLEEFNNLKKSIFLNLAKCHLEEGKELKEAEGILRKYLELENKVSTVSELESYLNRLGLIKEKLGTNFNDLDHLSFQIYLFFKQSKYRDIMRVGRLLKNSFIVVPEEKRDIYVKILQLVGDSFQKADYIYDAGDFYMKALEINPDNLETQMRIRQNLVRLNEEDKLRGIDERIKRLLTPREIWQKNVLIRRDSKFSQSLILDGRAVMLRLQFNKDSSGFAPLISIFFNTQVVWEDYLTADTVSIKLKSLVGKNTLLIKPVNRSVNLRRITWRPAE